MKKRVKILLLVLAALAGGAAYAASTLAPLPVEARAVHPETATLTFTEQGSYEYAERRTVYPLVAGEVLEVRVSEGDTVAPGDVLAVVSASDYEHQIEQLNSAIAGYSAQITGVDQQDQQRKDELAASLENLKGQVTTLEGEMAKKKETEDSLQTQIEIQEMIVWFNRNVVDAARETYRDARDWEEDGAISQARQNYATAQSALTQSELTLEQLKAGNVPDDIYKGQMQSLEAQIESVHTQLEKSYTGGTKQYYYAQITAAQASIAQMREKAGQAEILAPIGGVVSALPVKSANIAAQQSPVATIGAGGRVEVYVPIREIDGVRVGDKVELILDKRLGKETIPGVVTEVEQEAVVQLSALGVEERKVRVLIRPQRPLPVGYGMDVRFTVYTRENAVVAPKTALFSADGQDCVWVLTGETLEQRAVTKGIETRDGYIIDEGLLEGDLVVIDADNADLIAGRKAKPA